MDCKVKAIVESTVVRVQTGMIGEGFECTGDVIGLDCMVKAVERTQSLVCLEVAGFAFDLRMSKVYEEIKGFVKAVWESPCIESVNGIEFGTESGLFSCSYTDEQVKVLLTYSLFRYLVHHCPDRLNGYKISLQLKGEVLEDWIEMISSLPPDVASQLVSLDISGSSFSNTYLELIAPVLSQSFLLHSLNFSSSDLSDACADVLSRILIKTHSDGAETLISVYTKGCKDISFEFGYDLSAHALCHIHIFGKIHVQSVLKKRFLHLDSCALDLAEMGFLCNKAFLQLKQCKIRIPDDTHYKTVLAFMRAFTCNLECKDVSIGGIGGYLEKLALDGITLHHSLRHFSIPDGIISNKSISFLLTLLNPCRELENLSIGMHSMTCESFPLLAQLYDTGCVCYKRSSWISQDTESHVMECMCTSGLESQLAFYALGKRKGIGGGASFSLPDLAFTVDAVLERFESGEPLSITSLERFSCVVRNECDSSQWFVQFVISGEHLRTLHVKDIQFNRHQLETLFHGIERFHCLRSLSLQNTGIDDTTIILIEPLLHTTLIDLDLRRNKLTNKSLMVLVESKRKNEFSCLSSIDLRETLVSSKLKEIVYQSIIDGVFQCISGISIEMLKSCSISAPNELLGDLFVYCWVKAAFLRNLTLPVSLNVPGNDISTPWLIHLFEFLKSNHDSHEELITLDIIRNNFTIEDSEKLVQEYNKRFPPDSRICLNGFYPETTDSCISMKGNSRIKAFEDATISPADAYLMARVSNTRQPDYTVDGSFTCSLRQPPTKKLSADILHRGSAWTVVWSYNNPIEELLTTLKFLFTVKSVRRLRLCNYKCSTHIVSYILDFAKTKEYFHLIFDNSFTGRENLQWLLQQVRGSDLLQQNLAISFIDLYETDLCLEILLLLRHNFGGKQTPLSLSGDRCRQWIDFRPITELDLLVAIQVIRNCIGLEVIYTDRFKLNAPWNIRMKACLNRLFTAILESPSIRTIGHVSIERGKVVSLTFDEFKCKNTRCDLDYAFFYYTQHRLGICSGPLFIDANHEKWVYTYLGDYIPFVEDIRMNVKSGSDYTSILSAVEENAERMKRFDVNCSTNHCNANLAFICLRNILRLRNCGISRVSIGGCSQEQSEMIVKALRKSNSVTYLSINGSDTLLSFLCDYWDNRYLVVSIRDITVTPETAFKVAKNAFLLFQLKAETTSRVSPPNEHFVICRETTRNNFIRLKQTNLQLLIVYLTRNLNWSNRIDFRLISVIKDFYYSKTKVYSQHELDHMTNSTSP